MFYVTARTTAGTTGMKCSPIPVPLILILNAPLTVNVVTGTYPPTILT